MLSLSYAAASTAMIAAAFYLVLRLRPFITTTTMLVGPLLLIYGPAFLSFTRSSGEYALLIRPFTAGVAPPPSIFTSIRDKGLEPGAIITAMNFSVALTYVGIILGIEAANRAVPARAPMLAITVAGWRNQTIEDDARSHSILLIVMFPLVLLMLYFSVSENHLGTISQFSSPSLFIADALADFSYAGVILYSIIAGAVCRIHDVAFLARGKSVGAVAVLGATLVGVLTLLTTALNIALITGGLLLAPILAGVLTMTPRSLNRVA